MKLILLGASALLHMMIITVVNGSAANLRASMKTADEEAAAAHQRFLQTQSFAEYKALHPVPSYWDAYRLHYGHKELKPCAFLEYLGLEPKTGTKCWGSPTDYWCARGERVCASDVVPESMTHPSIRCDCDVTTKTLECSEWDPCFEPQGTIESCPATKPVGLEETCAVPLSCMYEEFHCCDDSLSNAQKQVTRCDCKPDGTFECKRLNSKNICQTIQCPEVDNADNVDIRSPEVIDVPPPEVSDAPPPLAEDARPIIDDVPLLIDPRPQQFIDDPNQEEIFLLSGPAQTGVCPFNQPNEGDPCDVFGEFCSYHRHCCPDGTCHFTYFHQCNDNGKFDVPMVVDVECRPPLFTLLPSDVDDDVNLLDAPITSDVRKEKPAPWLDPGTKTIWPELEHTVCQPDAVDRINAEDNGINIVYCIPEGTEVSQDFRIDRVRMFYSEKEGPLFGKITHIPHVG